MIPFLYAPIRMRVRPVVGDLVTVALLLVAPAHRRVDVARARLRRVLRGPDQPYELAEEYIDEIEERACLSMAAFQPPSLPPLLAWWRARAANREDFVQLGDPAAGAAPTLDGMADALLTQITGLKPRKISNAPATRRAIAVALVASNWRGRMHPLELDLAQYRLRLGRAARNENRVLALDSLEFANVNSAGAFIERAGRFLTRAEVLRQHDLLLRSILVTSPPPSTLERVWDDLRPILMERDVHVVPPEADAVLEALIQLGGPHVGVG